MSSGITDSGIGESVLGCGLRGSVDASEFVLNAGLRQFSDMVSAGETGERESGAEYPLYILYGMSRFVIFSRYLYVSLSG